MSIRRRLLEKGIIVKKVLVDILSDHEERIKALEGAGSEQTTEPTTPSGSDEPTTPSSSDEPTNPTNENP